MLKLIAIVVPFLDDATQRAKLFRIGGLLKQGGAILTTAHEVRRYALDDFPDVGRIGHNAAIVMDQLPGESDVVRASQFIEKYLPKSPVYLHASGEAANMMSKLLSNVDIGVYAFTRGAGVGGPWNDLVTLINSEGDKFEITHKALSQGHNNSQAIGLLYEYALRTCVDCTIELNERLSLLSEMKALGLIDEAVRRILVGMSASDFVSEIGRLSTSFGTAQNGAGR